METMTNGVSMIDLIDQIEAEESFAEMQVCNALLDSYSKSICILENCSEDADLSAFDVFQEGALSNAFNEAKGDKSENLIIRIIKFIPRFIAAFVRNLKNNRKAVEKKVKQVEEMSKDLIDTFEHPESHASANANQTDTKPVEDGKSKPEVTERRGVLGASYGDDDSAKRKAARATRSMKSRSKTMFTLPMKDNWFRSWTNYVDKDLQIDISTNILQFVQGLEKETVDYQALMEPVEHAIAEIAIAFSSDNSIPHKDWSKEDVIFAANLKKNSAGMSTIITSISRQLDEADAQLKKIKDFANNAKNDGSKTKILISKVIERYRYSLDWMAHVEHVLENTSEKMNEITKRIGGINMKKKSKIEDRGLEMSATMNVADKRQLTQCAQRVQRIVSDSETVFHKIIAGAYSGLDQLGSEIITIAKENGITVKSDMMKSRSDIQFFGFANDTSGYINNGYGTKTKTIAGF